MVHRRGPPPASPFPNPFRDQGGGGAGSVADIVAPACMLGGERRVKHTLQIRPRQPDVGQLAISHQLHLPQHCLALAPRAKSRRECGKPLTQAMLARLGGRCLRILVMGADIGDMAEREVELVLGDWGIQCDSAACPGGVGG